VDLVIIATLDIPRLILARAQFKTAVESTHTRATSNTNCLQRSKVEQLPLYDTLATTMHTQVFPTTRKIFKATRQ